MSVDGQTIDGNTIPLNLGGSVVNVQVVLE
jgi:hypothetical protein